MPRGALVWSLTRKRGTTMFPFDQTNAQQYQQYAQASDSGDDSGID